MTSRSRNLVWELRRWTGTRPHPPRCARCASGCRACAGSDLLMQQEWLNDFTVTEGTAAYDDELSRLTDLDRRRAGHKPAQQP